jgi:hypothetical protein
MTNSVIIVKVIRHLDTEQCQQYQNLCISNAGNTSPSTAMDLSSQPRPSTPWTKVTKKKKKVGFNRKTQLGTPNTSKKTPVDFTQPRPTIVIQLYRMTKTLTTYRTSPLIPLLNHFPSLWVTSLPYHPLLQLLDQIVKQSYKIKALAENQVRIQPKTPDSYRAIITALAGKKYGIPHLQTKIWT